ncbi:MAG: hypothetical protein R3240_12715, partial [Gammaproteobacteria bacterium]|nr:hypothetical protein [Gammaproteobacteria bacterium]
MNRSLEIFKQALLAVMENRVRSIMSIVGIAVGIAAVLIVGTVSSNGKDYIYTELESYGLESLWVYRKMDENNPLTEQRQGSGITNSDLFALRDSKCCPNVTVYSPSVYA